MRLRYKNSARVDLQSFVDHYEEAFRELYRDSGLWNESNIIKGYQKNAAKLYDQRYVDSATFDHPLHLVTTRYDGWASADVIFEGKRRLVAGRKIRNVQKNYLWGHGYSYTIQFEE